MHREEGAKEEDRQTEMQPPLRLLSVLSAHSSSFKPSFAVSITDFSDGPIPWTGDKRQLWNESRIIALFSASEDVAEALAMAADSCQFKKIEVAKGLWIVPKWSTPPDPEALNVMLDPGLAFGTGEHPTTRLCLQWLQHAMRFGDQIFDYGTGSGILSIAALKMGVDGAVGVDIDPMAITSAKYNASSNNIEPHMF
ncbi:unnamed protein product [Sphagnum jensenii]|uniref:ETFB lysine methyltransferase n=1 Tax=Sphagnum jensenii TaxID=128206 RepID=A0ABP1AFP8_9BRYO